MNQSPPLWLEHNSDWRATLSTLSTPPSERDQPIGCFCPGAPEIIVADNSTKIVYPFFFFFFCVCWGFPSPHSLRFRSSRSQQKHGPQKKSPQKDKTWSIKSITIKMQISDFPDCPTVAWSSCCSLVNDCRTETYLQWTSFSVIPHRKVFLLIL